MGFNNYLVKYLAAQVAAWSCCLPSAHPCLHYILPPRWLHVLAFTFPSVARQRRHLSVCQLALSSPAGMAWQACLFFSLICQLAWCMEAGAVCPTSTYVLTIRVGSEFHSFTRLLALAETGISYCRVWTTVHFTARFSICGGDRAFGGFTLPKLLQ